MLIDDPMSPGDWGVAAEAGQRRSSVIRNLRESLNNPNPPTTSLKTLVFPSCPSYYYPSRSLHGAQILCCDSQQLICTGLFRGLQCDNGLASFLGDGVAVCFRNFLDDAVGAQHSEQAGNL